jgi:hypothetical protein
MQLVTIGLDPNSDGVHDCPKVTVDAHDDDGPIYIQAPQVTDPEALAQSMPGSGEVLCALPREVFLQAARRILRT